MAKGFIHGKPSIDKSKGLTATAADILLGKTALVNGQILAGTFAVGTVTPTHSRYVINQTSINISIVPGKKYFGCTLGSTLTTQFEFDETQLNVYDAYYDTSMSITKSGNIVTMTSIYGYAIAHVWSI